MEIITIFAFVGVFLLTLSMAFNSPFGYVLAIIIIIIGIGMSIKKK